MRRRFINNSKNIHNSFNYSNYLTIESASPNCYVSFSNDCEYTINGSGIWIQLSANTYTKRITKGQTLSFRGNLISTFQGIGTFFVQGDFNLKGNCMSMLFGDNAANNYSLMGNTFCRLFEDCTGLLSVSENFLPATTLSSYCYEQMFKGCTNLVNAPELPATILTYYCYYGMFSGCTSLVTAPELPATTLYSYCYYSMFYGCTSLTVAPELPATIISYYCYQHMFSGCRKLNYIKMLATKIFGSDSLGNWVSGVSSTGTFVKHPNMTSLTTGDSGIPRGWTVYNDGEEPNGGLNITIPIESGFYQLDNERATIIKNYCLQFGDNYSGGGIPNGFSLTINGLSITVLYISTLNGLVNIMGTDDKNSLELIIDDGSDYNYVIIYN